MNPKFWTKALFLLFVVTLLGCSAYLFFSYRAIPEVSEVVLVKNEDYEKIEDLLESMTLDEKIGQLLFARIPASNAVSELTEYHLGGYILFGRDVENRSLEQIKNDVSSYKNAPLKVEPFIGIDEEGGVVSRLSYAGLADFKSPRELLSDGCGLCSVKKETRDKAAMLEDLGINVNFAPVADLCDNPNSFMYQRSAGSDPEFVSEYINAVTSIYSFESKNISATLKHFPGYGCNVDTHTGIAVDDRPIEEYRSADFLPFSKGIEAGADFVMVSHNIINAVDSANPASLSSEIYKILKDELKFSGVAITDDLSMDAISQYYHGTYPATVQTVLAGSNMLIVSDYKTAFSEIKKAVEDGVISIDLIEERLLPVLDLKNKKQMRLTR